MIGQYRIIATLMGVDEDKSALGVHMTIEHIGNPDVLKCFNSEVFEAILKAMKKSNKEAFYDAMIHFTDEELSGAM